MKILPILLLNVVVAAAAILVYDQLRSDDAAVRSSGPADGIDTSIEARLAALEKDRPALLKTDGIDPRVTARLAALERGLEERTAPKPKGVVDAAHSTELDAEPSDGPPQPSQEGPTSPEEVARFRKLQKVARAADKAQAMRKRVDQALGKLELSLSKAQRTKLAATFAGFQARRSEVWSEAKTNGAAQGSNADWATIIDETNTLLRGEFSDRVDDFLPRGDAERVAAALLGSRK